MFVMHLFYIPTMDKEFILVFILKWHEKKKDQEKLSSTEETSEENIKQNCLQI